MKETPRFMSPFLPPKEEYEEYLEQIWDVDILTNNGPLHKQLESKLKSFLDVENFALYSSGHLALESVLQAYEIKGEVITTPLTFASTAHAILRIGATPVFCDVRKDNLTMDPDKIEELITEKTSAILPVHVYGHICDMDSIERIANKYRLKVIYDAAHTFGVKKADDNIYAHGDASILSFHATKFFHTVEGGGIICRDSQMQERLISNRNFGLYGSENCIWPGGNAKMSEFHAAMGLCNFKYVQQELEMHRKLANAYQNSLKYVEGIRIMEEEKSVCSSFPYYYIIFEGGDKLRQKVYEQLLNHGYMGRKYFYPLLTDMKSLQGKFRMKGVPVAAKISDGILCLPLYSTLQIGQVEEICNIVKETLG